MNFFISDKLTGLINFMQSNSLALFKLKPMQSFLLYQLALFVRMHL